MNADQEGARAATLRFYDAIHDLMVGKGMAAMDQAWSHAADVSGSHPMGDWAYGWDEVRATWEVLSTLPANPGFPKAAVNHLRVNAVGDMAWATLVYETPGPGPGAKGLALNCTNVLRRENGVWKVVHHHADKSPELDKMIGAMA